MSINARWSSYLAFFYLAPAYFDYGSITLKEA